VEGGQLGDRSLGFREARAKRKKEPSKKFREAGHTPLSVEEEIPWKCRRLVIGTGAGALPIMKE